MPGKSSEASNKKKKRKTWWLLMLLAFLLCLVMYPMLGRIGAYFKVERSELVSEPFYVIKEVNESVQVTKTICSNVSFRYGTTQGNVDSIGNSVRPNLIMHNLEDAWGFYRVMFYFISEKEFPYERYGGDRFLPRYDAGEISLEDAKFSSDWYEFYIGPIEAVLINNLTLNTGGETNYWAIADIIEPKYEKCLPRTEYNSETRNKTFTEQKMVRKSRYVKEYLSFNDYFRIGSFGNWFVILLMFFLIIILLIMIHEKYIQRKDDLAGYDSEK